LARPITTSFWRITVPLLPISSSTTPFHASRPASVTTNDGTPTFVMISPCSVPIAQAGHERDREHEAVGSSLPSGVSRIAVSTPPTPETKPIDRSISPEQQRERDAHRDHDDRADCTIRLTKLPAVRKRSFWVWKMIAITIRPTMMGSEPSSPWRRLVIRSRA
jgi:hypothetical protein